MQQGVSVHILKVLPQSNSLSVYPRLLHPLLHCVGSLDRCPRVTLLPRLILPFWPGSKSGLDSCTVISLMSDTVGRTCGVCEDNVHFLRREHNKWTLSTYLQCAMFSPEQAEQRKEFSLPRRFCSQWDTLQYFLYATSAVNTSLSASPWTHRVDLFYKTH